MTTAPSPPELWLAWRLLKKQQLKFDRRVGSNAAEPFVKFQNDMLASRSNLAASRLHEIV